VFEFVLRGGVGCCAVAFAASLLAGCDARGFSSREAELDRVRQGPFEVISANHSRAVVSANGRQVAIEPANGFCLAEESIETSGRSAFALIGDCALSEASGSRNRSANGELQLPKGLPGFLTVSVSGGPAFGSGGSSSNLEELQAFLDTPDGRKMLGRGGNSDSVSVEATRQVGDSLYLLVEDKNASSVPLFAPKFWRAFVELNDRLAVVTISGFRDRPMTEKEMLGYLVSQVRKLRTANRLPINEERTLIAERTPRPRALDPAEEQLISDLETEALIVTAENEVDGSTWPAPPARPALGGPAEEDLSDESIGLAEQEDAEAKDNATLIAGVVIPPVRPDLGVGAPEPQPAPATDVPTVPEAVQTVLTNPAEEPESREQSDSPATKNAPQSAPLAPVRPQRA
jgi:hypothetical protein